MRRNEEDAVRAVRGQDYRRRAHENVAVVENARLWRRVLAGGGGGSDLSLVSLDDLGVDGHAVCLGILR